jgi:hypothetical protein
VGALPLVDVDEPQHLALSQRQRPDRLAQHHGLFGCQGPPLGLVVARRRNDKVAELG